VVGGSDAPRLILRTVCQMIGSLLGVTF
jgi:hypothetical protein